MRATIRWTRRARLDLLEIGDFIARDKPGAAAMWVGKILNAVERTAFLPTSGRIVSKIDRNDIREVILDSYRIVYQERDHQIVVLTVFEGHRLLSESDLDSNTSE